MVENSLQEFCLLNSDYTIHTSSKKHGRLIYNKNWDLVTKLCELIASKTDESSNDSLYSTASKICEVRSDKMFYVVRELRKWLKEDKKLLRMYGKYPELLQSASLKNLVFCRTKIEFTDDSKSEEHIPLVDPLLLNCFYYLICPEKDARTFEDNFDPTWGSTYTERFNKQNCLLNSRALVFTLDVLYHHNKNNVYPFHILLADLISYLKPTKLMTLLNKHRKFVSAQKYNEYKATIANNIKQLKSSGTILGLKQEIFTVMHMDNLEQYAKHHCNPSKALTSSLVIGVQQPLPKDQNMKVQKNVDFQLLDARIFTLPQTVDELGVSCNAPSASEITDILEDDYMTSSQDSQSSQDSVPSSQLGDQSNIQEKSVNPSSEQDYLLDETDESLLTSQASQSSSDSDATIIDTEPPVTRGRMRLSNESESSTSMLLETTTATFSEPGKKRLKLSFDAQHLLISKYNQPTEMTPEMWICNVSNFVLS